MKKLDKIAKLLEGIRSIICLFPQENRRKITLPNTPIFTSLKNDWEKVRADMYHAFEKMKSQQFTDKKKTFLEKDYN